jgi:hypothetical protein
MWSLKTWTTTTLLHYTYIVLVRSVVEIKLGLSQVIVRLTRPLSL